ncbi:hypothetical protein DsansV1_C05g0057051 [Dioscorea sansibarensis]
MNCKQGTSSLRHAESCAFVTTAVIATITVKIFQELGLLIRMNCVVIID